jgi:hypothetical protein
MRPSRAVDRAAFALGVVSLVSAVAGLLRGTFGFVHLGSGGFAVVLAWVSSRLLAAGTPGACWSWRLAPRTCSRPSRRRC